MYVTNYLRVPHLRNVQMGHRASVALTLNWIGLQSLSAMIITLDLEQYQ